MERVSVMLIPLASSIHLSRSIEASNLARELLQKAGLKIFSLAKPAVKHEEIPRFPAEEYDAVVLFLASGGTSTLAARTAENMPYFIWAYDEVNSLSSALSARKKLRSSNAWRGEVVYNSLDEPPIEVLATASASRLLKSLRRIRFGILGEEECLKQRAEEAKWMMDLAGIEVVTIGIGELLDAFSRSSEQSGSKVFESRLSRTSVVEPSRREIVKASRVYLALKDVFERNRLDAITLDCFKFLKRTGASTCLAFSLLSDEGKLAVCEGDLESGFLMLMMQRLADFAWLANLVQVDENLNMITLSHCTAPLAMSEPSGSVVLRSHFESDHSVGLDVPLRHHEVTVANFQSKPPQLIVVHGTIVESQIGKFSLCRTQAKVKLKGEVGRLTELTGNHHVLVYGNWVETLSRIGDKLGLPVVIA